MATTVTNVIATDPNRRLDRTLSVRRCCPNSQGTPRPPVVRLSFGVEAVRLMQGPPREGRPFAYLAPFGDVVNGSFIFVE